MLFGSGREAVAPLRVVPGIAFFLEVFPVDLVSVCKCDKYGFIFFYDDTCLVMTNERMGKVSDPETGQVLRDQEEEFSALNLKTQESFNGWTIIYCKDMQTGYAVGKSRRS